jgi:hypothetical protein
MNSHCGHIEFMLKLFGAGVASWVLWLACGLCSKLGTVGCVMWSFISGGCKTSFQNVRTGCAGHCSQVHGDFLNSMYLNEAELKVQPFVIQIV